MVAQLKLNPDRRFTYVEVAFFDRWWSEQTEETKADVRLLVASQQLEFANGGWQVPHAPTPTNTSTTTNATPCCCKLH